MQPGASFYYVLATFLLVLPAQSFVLPLHPPLDSRLSTRAVDVSKNQHTLKLKNTNDKLYSTTINLGGQDVAVQLDTGSSDLWVKSPSFQPTLVTNVPVSITYGQGMISGSLSFAPMTIGGFSIPRQSFIRADQVVNEDALINNGITGLMGLGFPPGSRINDAVASVPTAPRTDGRSPLENIFAANTTLPRFFTFLLGRQDDPSNEIDGVFTISEYVDSLSNVSTTQKLTVQAPDHWSVLIDSMKVGERTVQSTTNEPNAPPGKTVAQLDTGSTLPQVPLDVVNFVYSAIPGAVQTSDISAFNCEWVIPCDQAVSLTFIIGGQEFPIHPLDLTRISSFTVQGKTVNYCSNTFRPLTLDPASFSGFDMLLGDSFLRNSYTSFNYGSTDARGRVTEAPFVQMLPLTDKTKTQEEFSAVRQKQLQASPAPFTPVQLRAAVLGQVPLPAVPTEVSAASTAAASPTVSAESNPQTPPAPSGSAGSEEEKKESSASTMKTSFFALTTIVVVIMSSLV